MLAGPRRARRERRVRRRRDDESDGIDLGIGDQIRGVVVETTAVDASLRLAARAVAAGERHQAQVRDVGDHCRVRGGSPNQFCQQADGIGGGADVVADRGQEVSLAN